MLMAELIVFLIAAATAYIVGSRLDAYDKVPDPHELMSRIASETPRPQPAATSSPEPPADDPEDTFLEGTPEEIMAQLGMTEREFRDYLRSGKFYGGGNG